MLLFQPMPLLETIEYGADCVRRGLGVGSRLLNPGVCGSNPGRGVIPLWKEFTTNFLPQVTALWR